jgi:hypothetical protein
LTTLTKKDIPFVFDEQAVAAFKNLKDAFLGAPVLAHYDPDLELWVETDASNYVVAGVLSQMHADRVLRPVVFFSRRLSPAECNYDIYDKELLAVVRVFEEWRPELIAADKPINSVVDHRNL